MKCAIRHISTGSVVCCATVAIHIDEPNYSDSCFPLAAIWSERCVCAVHARVCACSYKRLQTTAVINGWVPVSVCVLTVGACNCSPAQLENVRLKIPIENCIIDAMSVQTIKILISKQLRIDNTRKINLKCQWKLYVTHPTQNVNSYLSLDLKNLSSCGIGQESRAFTKWEFPFWTSPLISCHFAFAITCYQRNHQTSEYRKKKQKKKRTQSQPANRI